MDLDMGETVSPGHDSDADIVKLPNLTHLTRLADDVDLDVNMETDEPSLFVKANELQSQFPSSTDVYQNDPVIQIGAAAAGKINDEPQKSSMTPKSQTPSVRGGKNMMKPFGNRRSSRIAKIREDAASAVYPQAKAASSPRKPGRPTRNTKKGKPAGKATESVTSNREWEVEKFVDSCICADTYCCYYLVKWKGFPDKDSTWEPKVNLDKCRSAIVDFEGYSQKK